MKRTLVSLLAAVCIICLMAFGVSAAAPETTIISSMDGTIAITGTATPGEYVTAIVLNPGYDESDFVTSPAEAIQYFYGQVAQESNECGHAGNYCFHAGIHGVDGDFTVIVNDGEEKVAVPFAFYSAGTKFDDIEMVNGATKAYLLEDANEEDEVDETRLDVIYDHFSLADTELYKEGDKGAIAAALIAYRNTMDGNVFGDETAEDLDNFYAMLSEVSLVAAYNADMEDLVVDEDGNFLYTASIMNIADTDEIADCIEYITEAGKGDMLETLFKDTYTKAEEIEENILSLTYLHILVDYVERGNGHVEGYLLDKYEDAYDEAGFKLGKLDDVKNPSTYYSKIVASNKTTLKDLAEEFNDLFDKKSSGGSGGGKVFSDSADSGYIPGTGDVVITPVTPVKPTFTDLAGAEWAVEAITALSEQGIISGRGDGVFAPADNVTRAEFVKIIVSAFGGVHSAASCNFVDVADDWAKPYIATAFTKGYVSGTSETTFAPAGQITREQAAVIIYKVLTGEGKTFETVATFADDAAISAYAKDAVAALKGAGIINGRDGDNFCPGETLTRAEAAKLIYSIINVQ
ncbi:MAG: S-layer homology domain-containing protein [Ruminococcaceae bacterium]|nr:S-layer homology domain-containing protein [Oscillospiraceae bacterium]